MFKKNYSFLSNYFGYEFFELNKGHGFEPAIKSLFEEYDINPCQAKYGYVFYEKNTNLILNRGYSSSEIIDFSSFAFYLQLLPSLSIHDVAYLFSLEHKNGGLNEKLFMADENYPSEYAKEILKDTYGHIVYIHQLEILLSACLPHEEITHSRLNEYRIWFNKRLKKMQDILEKLYLPDGYNLAKLLKNYTPIRSKWDSSEYGFVFRADYNFAFKFIKLAKKYSKK